SVHDPLRVGVEVMAGLEVAADQEDDFRVGVVGARPVVTHPEGVSGARARRTDVGVRIVTVYPPRREDPLHQAVVPGAADVVHDLVLASLLEGLPDPAPD